MSLRLVPSALVVAAVTAATNLFQSFRRDYYLPGNVYPEMWADRPVEGGRVHYVCFASPDLELKYPLTVGFGDNLDPVVIASDTNLPEDLDWIYSRYDKVSGTVWVSFHAHTDSYLKSIKELTIKDDGNILLVNESEGADLTDKLSRSDKVGEHEVEVTYITSNSNFEQLIIHIHNFASEPMLVNAITLNKPLTLPSIFRDASDVDSYDIRVFSTSADETIASATATATATQATELLLSEKAPGKDMDPFVVEAGGHAVRIFEAPALGLSETSIVTALLNYSLATSKSNVLGNDESDGTTVAYGVRLTKELFPMEDWPKSAQCPYPVQGANISNFEILRDEMHLNTRYIQGVCDASTQDIYEAAAASVEDPDEEDWFVLVDTDVAEDMDPKYYPGVGGIFLGDEDDSSYDNAKEKWQKALRAEDASPGLATYLGGHSQHYIGTFAGIADIQGMDFYVAACAPHITGFLSKMLPRGAYDYIRLSRNNQMPLSTWAYSQAYSQSWAVVPNGNEIVLQLASVVAAGSKGMMLFQSDVELQGTEPWTTGAAFMGSVKLLAPLLRVSDVGGALYSLTLPSQPAAVAGSVSGKEGYKNASGNGSHDSSAGKVSADGDGNDDGDANGNSNEPLVDILRTPDSLVLSTISTNAYNYSDVLCYLPRQPYNHWLFENYTIPEVRIQIPADMLSQSDPALEYEVVEVVDGTYTPAESIVDVEIELIWNDDASSTTTTATSTNTATATATTTITITTAVATSGSPGEWVLRNLLLSDSRVARIFVLRPVTGNLEPHSS